MKLQHLQRCYTGLLILKALSILVTLLLPLSLPHIWRQADTLGVAMRYWLRWETGFDFMALVPAVLNSGSAYGYMAMEFPLLNVVLAPAFVFGPEVGSFLARLGLCFVNLGLWYWACRVWQGACFRGLEWQRCFYWLPLLGITSVYMGRFIPDPSAMLFCLVGCGYLYGHRASRSGLWLGLGLVALGILIKPPAVVTCGVLLLQDRLSWYQMRRLVISMVVVCLPTLFYYTAVNSYIAGLEVNAPLFKAGLQNPLQNLLGFFSQPLLIYRLLSKGVLFPGGVVLLLIGLWLLRSEVKGLWYRLGPAIGVLGLMMFGVAFLDGGHSFAHAYYHIGLMPVAAYVFYSFLVHNSEKVSFRWVQGLLIFAFFLDQLSQASFDTRGLWHEAPSRRMPAFAECQELKQQLAELPWQRQQVFMTHNHLYPKLGICFGERVGADRAMYGLFYLDEDLPLGCEPLARSAHLQVTRCNG